LSEQDDEAHLYVGVTIRQPSKMAFRRGSLLMRRSVLPLSTAADDLDESGGPAAWQPEDSILEGTEGSPASSGSTAGLPSKHSVLQT
jgi:hypothetical protein